MNGVLGGITMKTHIVRYILPNGTRESIEVVAYNVFHAEKVAKKKIDPQARISSVSTLSKKA